MKNDCIFCKLAQGEAPCLKIYEDEFTFSMMDIAKDVDGHILVIPKKHCVSILDCDQETLIHVSKTVKIVSNHLVNNCGYEGVDLLSANGEAAGQSLPHFHIHIIPRRTGDGLGGRGEWPCFPGAKQDIHSMHRLLKLK